MRWLTACLSRYTFALLAACALYSSVLADDTTPVIRIEEDWELIVQAPDADINAPQIVMAFTPLGNVNGLHATFEINHISSVLSAPGGLHLSVWNGDLHLAVKHAGDFAIMREERETVRWTQVIEVQDNITTFRIENGTSTTWGDFNSKDHGLALSVESSTTDLSNYSPAVSAKQSDVSYAGNRVRSLSLRKVRYIKRSGAVTEDNTLRIAHESESNE